MSSSPDAPPGVRSREYRWLVGAQTVSMVGNAMTNTALYWLAIHVARGDALGLAGVAAAECLPMLGLSRWAGTLAARHRPGQVAMLTTVAELIGALAIGLPLLGGWMTIWYLWLLGLGIGAAQTIGLPAGQMFLLDLVGSGELRRGASVSSLVTGLAKIGGPGLAGVMIATIGTGPVFLADAASFLGVIAVRAWLNRIVHPPAGRSEAAAPARRLRWLLDLPRSIQLAALTALMIGGFGYQFAVTNPLMATKVFHLRATQFGILGTLMAVGGVAGSFYSARRPDPRGPEFALWSLVFAGAELAAAVMPVAWAYEAVMVLIGATITLFAITTTVFIRRVCPPGQLGHALSAYNAAFIGFVPAGALAVAAISALAGVRWALVLPALAVLAVAGFVLAASRTRPEVGRAPG